MWAISKIFIGFVTTLLLFMFWFFWLWGMRDLILPTKDWIYTLCNGKWKCKLLSRVRLIVHGILQSRILGWVAFPFSRGSSQLRDQTPASLLCRQILHQLSHKGSPRILEYVTYPFSSGSSWPRNRTWVSSTAGGFFTNWAIRKAPTLESTVLITEPPGKSPSVLLFLKEHRIRPDAFMGHFTVHKSSCGVSNLPSSCSLFLLYDDMLMLLLLCRFSRVRLCATP